MEASASAAAVAMARTEARERGGVAQAAKMQWWCGLLLLIPFVNIVVAVMMCIGISKAFGRGAGTAIGLFFLTPIFAMILGFGSAEYDGEASSFG